MSYDYRPEDVRRAEIYAWEETHMDRLQDAMGMLGRTMLRTTDTDIHVVHLVKLLGQIATLADEHPHSTPGPDLQALLDQLAAGALNWSEIIEHQRRNLNPDNYR